MKVPEVLVNGYNTVAQTTAAVASWIYRNVVVGGGKQIADLVGRVVDLVSPLFNQLKNFVMANQKPVLAVAAAGAVGVSVALFLNRNKTATQPPAAIPAANPPAPVVNTPAPVATV